MNVLILLLMQHDKCAELQCIVSGNQEKREIQDTVFAACVEVMLDLIPLFGKVVWEAVFPSIALLLNITAQFLVEAGYDSGTVHHRAECRMRRLERQARFFLCAVTEHTGTEHRC